jgi:hypothetical protein
MCFVYTHIYAGHRTTCSMTSSRWYSHPKIRRLWNDSTGVTGINFFQESRHPAIGRCVESCNRSITPLVAPYSKSKAIFIDHESCNCKFNTPTEIPHTLADYHCDRYWYSCTCCKPGISRSCTPSAQIDFIEYRSRPHQSLRQIESQSHIKLVSYASIARSKCKHLIASFLESIKGLGQAMVPGSHIKIVDI